jgi:hypothetical protein
MARRSRGAGHAQRRANHGEFDYRKTAIRWDNPPPPESVKPHPSYLALAKLYKLLGQAVLIPIPLRQKGPTQAGWQKLTYPDTRTPDYQKELRDTIGHGGNIGVKLGPDSGRLLTLDIDDDKLIDVYLSQYPWLHHTLRSRSKRGCQFWLRLEQGCQYPNTQAVITMEHGELRLGGSGGAQSIIWGVHPAGMRYQMLVEKPPLVISLADLDELAPGVVFADAPQQPETRIASANDRSLLPRDIWDRVTRYLDTCEPAISGQRGHDTIYGVLCRVIHGFNLSPNQAWEAAVYYNRKCEPPWSEKELQHKVEDALKATPSEPPGHFLETEVETPFFRRLKEEQAQRQQAENQNEQHSEPSGNDESMDLAAETTKRLNEYLTDPEPFPDPMRLEAFHGVIGQIVKIMTEHCESSPEVLLLHGIVIMGNIFGRSAYAYGGGPQLFPNEFAVFVGDTARARKGTARSMWEHLVVSANPDWLDGCLCTQIQTGEGVVYQIRDERRGVPPGKRRKNEPAQEVVIDQGVSDKRLLIVEEEFSHTLKMAQRSGNTLSETIRLAWDSPRLLKTSNKNSPLKASDPHISLIGHTTRGELLSTLKTVELSNGMANRVLWCAARRTGDMPNVEFLNWRHFPDLVDRLKEIFSQRFANTDDPTFFAKTPEAKSHWDQLYRKLNSEKRDSTLDSIVARDTSHILKLALIFAVADQIEKIEIQHLEAASAVVDFCQASACWIFGQATANKLANNILWALRRSPAGLTRSEIQKNVCFGKTPKTQLDRALSELIKNRLAKMTLDDAKAGPRTERWFATQ